MTQPSLVSLGMSVMVILDGISTLYSKPMPALEGNDSKFRSPYLPADLPKLLFVCIEDCAKIALLGHDPYTDHQLINTATRLLTSTGLYIQVFEYWDLLAPAKQTWIALRALIQTSFQGPLNAMAPTAGYNKYAPMLPHQQHGFGAIDTGGDDESVETVATQVLALTYQSKSTASTAANTSMCQEQQTRNLPQPTSVDQIFDLPKSIPLENFLLNLAQINCI